MAHSTTAAPELSMQLSIDCRSQRGVHIKRRARANTFNWIMVSTCRPQRRVGFRLSR